MCMWCCGSVKRNRRTQFEYQLISLCSLSHKYLRERHENIFPTQLWAFKQHTMLRSLAVDSNQSSSTTLNSQPILNKEDPTVIICDTLTNQTDYVAREYAYTTRYNIIHSIKFKIYISLEKSIFLNSLYIVLIYVHSLSVIEILRQLPLSEQKIVLFE